MDNAKLKISIVSALAILALSGLAAFLSVRAYKNDQKKKTLQEHRLLVAKKRDVMAAKVLERQVTADVRNAKTIDLGPFENRPLTNSFMPRRVKGNNLADLPEGTQVLAGVPFDIKGSIQLWGRGLKPFNVDFPPELKGIQISAKAGKLHLLHGAYFVSAKHHGAAISKIVLHYTNGSQKEIEILSGKHVLDCVVPVEDKENVSAPGSELAWVGSNAYLKKKKPDWGLRLYKSTFANPEPSLEVGSIDYVSAMTESAPFLVALTIEP